MRPVNFDLDAMRSFVTGVELGSFAKAAQKLARSTSAISAQLKKLEAQVGSALFKKAGRGLALTDTGEVLLNYSRRLLSLNDETITAVSELKLKGWVRLGLQEDFSSFLPTVLGRFARAHPDVRVEARIARNADLLSRIENGSLDLAVVWGDVPDVGYRERVAELQMEWIGSSHQYLDWRIESGAPLPIIAFDTPCPFHSVATAALNREGIPWLLSFTSSSLNGLSAATEAGLGYTIRTALGLQSGTELLAAGDRGLPPLPSISLTLHRREANPDPLTERLSKIVIQAIRSEIVH
ncbi:LysR substrate-binding domain-containing protein [Pseudomonas sp. H3(2019)]|uniref:LysR substrate-binding domain-containing protein n=1 Tax=Pseudomonas sp. H3(2019) TaxID=2598724 RepID=UPI001194AA3F|nr:LysR substrate-binding domain-containing protein [Pseudomonas sp. H3(2019)]TVT85187.1 LysR family transcriptional regulator [Pseudomonas sp. H3(2019)]